MLVRRKAILPEVAVDKSRKIFEKLIIAPVFVNARNIGIYSATKNEVGTDEIIRYLVASGKSVWLPVAEGKSMDFFRFKGFDRLKKGKFNVPEPERETGEKTAGELDEFGGLDVIIVPGVCFDSHLHRLGYGKGHYDRYLKTCRAIRIGICFDELTVAEIPHDEYDERMDVVMTDARILRRTD